MTTGLVTPETRVLRMLNAEGVWRVPGFEPTEYEMGLALSDWYPSTKAQRDALTVGDYQPGPWTTGHYHGTPMSVFDGASDGKLIWTTPNTTFENLIFFCDMDIRATGVTFRNCILFGGTGHPSYNWGCITAQGKPAQNDGLLIEDCTIVSRYPSYMRDGINGNGMTVRRCNIWRNNDGIGTNAAAPSTDPDLLCNTVLEGNWSHDQVYWKSYPGQAYFDGSHNDGCHFHGGKNVTIRGNYFQATGWNIRGSNTPTLEDGSDNPLYPGNPRGLHPDGMSFDYANGSGLVMQPEGGRAIDNVLVEKNWFSHGSQQVVVGRGNGFTALTGITFRDNRFSRGTKTDLVWDGIFNHATASNPSQRWVTLDNNGAGVVIDGLWDGSSAEDDGTVNGTVSNTTNRFEDDTLLGGPDRTSGVFTFTGETPH